jgi:hypothetical protein
MALTGLSAVLLVPLLFLIRAWTWDHHAGMRLSDWAAQDLWPLALVGWLALLSMMYLSSRALWYVGTGARCPALLLVSVSVAVGVTLSLSLAYDLAMRAVILSHRWWDSSAFADDARGVISRGTMNVVIVAVAVVLLIALGQRYASSPRVERPSDD